MKILITGGRTYGLNKNSYGDLVPDEPAIEHFNQTLDAIHARKPITCIVQGGATGADRLAKNWALANLVECKEYKADWDKFGRVAGPIRNAHMLDQNTDIRCVLAFPGGAGTKNCMLLARSRNVNVLEC